MRLGRKAKTSQGFRGFENTGNFNPDDFSKLVRQIMGSRSQKVFAEDCGYSQGTISNVLRAVQKKVEPELAEAIWKNRDANCSVTEEEFLGAYGYTRNGDSSDLNFVEDFSVKSIVENILQKTFWAKKYSIQSCEESKDIEKLEEVEFDIIIETNAFGNKGDLWRIKILKDDTCNSISRMLEKFFSKLYTRKNIKTKLRLSVVTFNEVAFDEIRKKYANVRVSDYISVLLLDDKFSKIIDEFILVQRNERQKIESVLV